MKKVSILAFFTLVLFSCTHTRKSGKTEVNTTTLYEGEWFFNFKTEVFIRCLKKIYPQQFNKMVDSLDASYAANIEHLEYDTKIIEVADSLATSFAKRNEAAWTIENRKVTLNTCLAYRNSEELNRFAFLLYRKSHGKKETRK